MRILISNDDGLHAPGIKVLKEIALELSNDVWIVAPEVEQSGTGHSLSLMSPLRLKKISDQRYCVNGTPTDCMQIALKELLANKKPDLMLSGVNYGANLGEDVTYSGTIAAAMEATILGVPAIALSQSIKTGQPEQWETAAYHSPKIIKDLLQEGWAKDILININFPNLASKEVKGITCVRHGMRHEKGEITEWSDPRGEKFYWLASSTRKDNSTELDTDLSCVANGYISITPLHLDLTHYEAMTKMRKTLECTFTSD